MCIIHIVRILAETKQSVIGIDFSAFCGKSQIMDIAVLLLTFFGTYLFVIFLLLLIARLMFPKVEVADERVIPKTRTVRPRNVKRVQNRAE